GTGLGFGLALRCASLGPRLLTAIDGLADLERRLRQRLGGRFDAIEVVALRCLARGRDRCLNLRLDGSRKLIARIRDGPLRRVYERLEVVLRLDQLAPLLVLSCVSLGLLDHPLDVLIAEATRCLDADRLLLARRLVLGRDVDDAV